MEEQTLTLDDLYDTHVEEGYIKEGTSFDTVPGGKYTFQPDKVEPQVGTKEIITRLFGRKFAHIGGSITDENGNSRGKQWLDISWEERRSANGRLDKPSKLYGHYAKALGMETASVGELLDAITQFPVYLYVSEAAQDPSDPSKWETVPKADPGKKAEYIKNGWRLANFPQSVSAIK